MKMRWNAFLLIAFFILTGLSLTSLSFAQSRAQGNDADDDVLQQPLPPGIRVRAFIHRPRVAEPNHLGTCTVTANDQVNDFGLTGWHLSGSTTWRLSRSTVPSSISVGVDGSLHAAFESWYTGTFLQGSDTNAKAAKFDGVNAILWKKLGPFTIAVTYVWYSTSTGEVAEVDTVFNSRYPWAIFAAAPDCQGSPDAYDLQDIATHEFGHWIGLDDLYSDQDKDLTMYGFGAGGEVKKRTLGLGDISGINKLTP